MERSVLSSAGNESKSDKISLDWTLGELAVEKATSGKFVLTEGFQQGMKSSAVSATSNHLVVWPNPSEDLVYINWQLSSKQTELRLTDMSGKILKLKVVDDELVNSTLDLNDLRPGIYFLTLRNQAGNIIGSAKVCKIK